MMLQTLNREPELERHRSFRLAAKRCPMAACAKQSLALVIASEAKQSILSCCR
jgi:hypothetical protein